MKFQLIKPKKDFSTSRLVITGINMVMGMAFIIYHTNTNTADFNKSINLLKYAENKNNLPLIATLELKPECEDDEQPLRLYFWPGTFRGCVCSKNHKDEESERVDWNNYKFVYDCTSSKGNCAESNIVNSLNPRDFFKYASGNQFCFTTYSEGVIQNFNNCEENGYKSCSFGVCVLNDTPCPITRIEIGNEYKLTVKRENKSPMIGLRMSLEEKPCLNILNQNKRNNNRMFIDYPYLRAKAEGCKTSQDMTAIQLDQMTELQFFLENNMDEAFEEDLFLYKEFIAQSSNT